ncbi:MAG: SPOR domain-containing protein [Pseudomonadota bacterium]|nr:SPOR domain-containing protein [Pseudomonadota bacterium]
MDSLLKQRLIGTAVLIALAVIFVPVLLDGTGWRERRAPDAEIPPEPDFTFSRSLPSMSDARREVIPSVPPPVESRGIDPDPYPEAATATGDASPESEPRRQSVVSSDADREPEETGSTRDDKQDAGTTTAGSTDKTPAAETKSASRLGWVVQVGSFSSRKNAESLGAKLRASGYRRTFIEPVGSGASRRYRVKVGPEKDKAAAMTTRSRLKASEKLSGIVVRQR